MPQNPILVYSKEDGTPAYMHTVDAAEALKYGDYTSVPPGEELDPETRASALSRFKTGQGVTHPELQTEEEKAEARRKANEDAALLAGLPPGTPIVVQAPSDRPASRAAQQAASRAPAETPPRTAGTSSSARSTSSGSSAEERKP